MGRHAIIPAVYMILEQENKFLFLRRYQTGYQDGKYTFAAGHVDEGENAFLAAQRELMEEVGIHVELDDLEMIHCMHRKSELGEERVDWFIKVKNWSGDIKNCEPRKCDDLNWYTLDELSGKFVPYLEVFFDSFQNNQFYSEYGWE